MGYDDGYITIDKHFYKTQKLNPYIYTIRDTPRDLVSKMDELDRDVKYVLEARLDKYVTPDKVYGRYLDDAEHIINYFKEGDSNLGVIIGGLKGSGKTLTARLICNIGLKLGYPVVEVNDKTIDDGVINYLSTLNNCIIYIDEFLKIFSFKDTGVLYNKLTDTSKRNLWIFSCSNKNFPEDLINRPERVRYYLEYNKLDLDIVKEYCIDHGVDNYMIDQIVAKYPKLANLTFDQLQGVVTEHKYRPDYTLDDIARILNFKQISTRYSLVIKRCYVDGDDDVTCVAGYSVSIPNSGVSEIASVERLKKDTANVLINEFTTDITIIKQLANINQGSYNYSNLPWKPRNLELVQSEVRGDDIYVTFKTSTGGKIYVEYRIEER